MGSLTKAIKNPANVYLLLWTFYMLQGTLYDKSSIISKTLLIVVILLSLKEAFRMLRYYKYPPIFRSLNVLFIMYTIYALFFEILDLNRYIIGNYESSFIGNIKGVYTSFLPIYVFYLYTLKGYITEKLLRMWVPIFFVVAILGYFAAQREILEQLMETGSSRDEATNNYSYTFVFLLPCMILFRKKQLLMYSGMVVCMVFLIIGMKRGAIFIGCVTLYLILIKLFSQFSNSKKITLFAFIGVIIVVLFNQWNHMIETSDYFNQRLQATLEGEDSGRSDLWSNILSVFVNDTSLFQMIFGRGSKGTLFIGHNYAHNDWLEILIDNGLVGLFIFSEYWYRFYTETKSRKLNSISKLCLFVLFVSLFMKTLFSMSISSMRIYATLMLGFSLANGFEQERKYKLKCIK